MPPVACAPGSDGKLTHYHTPWMHRHGCVQHAGQGPPRGRLVITGMGPERSDRERGSSLPERRPRPSEAPPWCGTACRRPM